MRQLSVKKITKAIKEMAMETNCVLTEDVRRRIIEAEKDETFPIAKSILGRIRENIVIAEENRMPLCQDTGMACVFMEIGQDVHFTGGILEDAINEGVRQGYEEGYLRKSVVNDPLRRENTGDNTPASITYKVVEGDKVRIVFAPKGFGSENMSRITMLPPSAGAEGVKDFVVQTCMDAGANPCPPVIVGVGIGGTFDKVAQLAKEALLEPLDGPVADPYYEEIEKEILERINALGIGPQGLGGKTTALAVKIKTAPTHIAGLPVAVNINCHVSRREERIL